MSKRSSIVKSLAESLKVINGNAPYTTNLYENSFPILKFWDEIQDFPAVYVTAGAESREHLPGSFSWGHLNVLLRVYTKGEEAHDLLEELLEDIEKVISGMSGRLTYDTDCTADIYVTNIVTDEGLLNPYAVAEVTLRVQYPIT